MSYIKQNFEDGLILTAEHLNKMEDGIVKATTHWVDEDGTVHKLPSKFLPDDIGGVKSWNELEDRPFYSEGSIDEVLPEVEIDTIAGLIRTPFELQAGVEYIINWNDSTYKCVAKAATIFGTPGVAVGNVNYMNTVNTGEPFVIHNAPDINAGVYAQVITLDDSDIVKISIMVDNEKVYKLDNKYLDMDWAAKSEKKVIFEDNALQVNGMGVHRFDPTPFKLEAGKTYTVIIDGERYEYMTVCMTGGNNDDIDGIMTMVSLGDYVTQEPFCLEYTYFHKYDNDQVRFVGDKYKDTTISLTVLETIVTPLPSKFMPEGIVFTSFDMVTVSCNKTYEECMAEFIAGKCDVKMVCPGVIVGMANAVMFSGADTGVLKYSIVIDGLTLIVEYNSDGTITIVEVE